MLRSCALDAWVCSDPAFVGRPSLRTAPVLFQWYCQLNERLLGAILWRYDTIINLSFV